jgi:pimeloyl-ACP methyl ester carboxylesterase
MLARDSGYSTGKVRSADGTTIGYRQFGRAGRSLILVHGGMMAAQNFSGLAAALSDRFCVLVPDRRGRGTSGPFGGDYRVQRECEDIRALAAHSGADGVFGLSSGALIALEAALRLPEIRRVAAYEPPYSIAGRDNTAWSLRFDAEIAAGNLAAALVTVLKGTGDWEWVRWCPYALLTPLVNLALRRERASTSGDIPISALIPTMHYDVALVREVTANIERFRQLAKPCLLLGGSKSAWFLKQTLDAFEPLVPGARRVELRGVGHIAADNSGTPDRVAAELRSFFSA